MSIESGETDCASDEKSSQPRLCVVPGEYSAGSASNEVALVPSVHDCN